MDSPGNARNRHVKSEKRREFRMLLKQPELLFAILFVFAVLIIFCIYPIVRLFISCLTDKSGQLNLDNINYVFTKTDFFQAFWNSVKLGLFVGLMATIVGYVYAFAITRTSLPGKKFFNIMAILPILSPPFVISLAVMLLFGRSGLITKNLLHIRNNNIYGFTWLSIVQILSLFPLAYLNLKGMLETLDSSVENASRTLGAGSGHIIFREILPNTVGPIITQMMFSIPTAIFTEAFLSFVGVGIVLPQCSIGTLIEEGFNNITILPYQILPPILVLALLMLGFNFIGDGLREALAPKLEDM